MKNLTDKEKNKLLAAANLIENGDMAVLQKIIEFSDEIEGNTEKLEETVAKAEETVSSLIEQVESKLATVENGKDYVLTPEDRVQIAKSIEVPIVEKIIERVEVIKEQPVVNERITNEIREVAVLNEDELPQYGVKFRDGLELLKDDDRLDISAIKGIDTRENKLQDAIIDRAISIIDKRTSYLIQKVSNLSDKVNSSSAGAATTPGAPANSVQFNDGGTFGGDSAFVWDKTNDFLGIGTTPDSQLTVSKQTSIQAPPSGTLVHFTGLDANSLRITLDTHNNAGAGGTAFLGRRSRGTGAVPTAVQANDTILSMNGVGYGDNQFGAASTGLITIKANQNFTNSAMGTYISFFATPDGSTTAAEVGRFASDRLRVGVAGTMLGKIDFAGNTSGNITVQGAAAGGTSVNTLQAVTDTFVYRASTDTLTNKSIVATQLTGTAYTFAANNTNGTAAYTLIPFEDHPLATYAGTFTWNSTPPTTIVSQQYAWSRIGNTVTLFVAVFYTNAGATNTTCAITLPSDCPTPAVIAGAGDAASEYMYPVNGARVEGSMTGAPTAVRGGLRQNAGNNGYEVNLVFGSTAATHLEMTVIYRTS